MKDIKESLKQAVVDGGMEMVQQKLTVGTWGNISVRDPETGYMYIKPSAMTYEGIRAEHVVVLDEALNVVDGYAKPSIEKHMHAAVYAAREDVHAVIHTHPIYSSVLGVNRMELPGISEDFAQIVGDKIICSEYALPGTPDLGVNVVKALGERFAVLLPNHGTLCVGTSIAHALKICHVVEKCAHIYILAKSIGTPIPISDEDILAMQDFAKNHYGQDKD